jgi:hypothetical protein
LLATNFPNLPWGAATNGYQISLSTATNRYESGKPVELRFLFKNCSSNSITMSLRPALRCYDLLVSTTNEVIFPTAEGKRTIWQFQHDFLGGSNYTLRAGQSDYLFNTYPLNKIYDFSKPGTYRIAATRTFFGKDNKGVKIKSNTIELIIDPHQ